MGLMLMFLAVTLIISGLVYLGNHKDPGATFFATITALVVGAILGAFLIIVICTSYGTYVDLRTSYDAAVKQYRQAVTIYVDHAQIDVKKAALTDFKYQGYQENAANFVRDLRRKVVWYNEGIVSKRVMKKNWFFNWLIIAPDDDMKVINLMVD